MIASAKPMRGSRPAGLLLLALLSSAATVQSDSAQDGEPAPGPPHQTRLTVGEAPPTSFALAAAGDGEIFDLGAARGERPILLLFFRGTW